MIANPIRRLAVMSARTENVASETLSPAVRPIRPSRKMLVVQAVASISRERVASDPRMSR